MARFPGSPPAAELQNHRPQTTTDSRPGSKLPRVFLNSLPFGGSRAGSKLPRVFELLSIWRIFRGYWPDGATEQVSDDLGKILGHLLLC